MTENLYTQLAKAQAEFDTPKRTKTVTGAYTFHYAPLDEVLAAVRPALGKYGLFLTQDIVTWEERECVRTRIYHGEAFIENHWPMIVTERGAQKHAGGSTFARRYGISALLALAPEDDDDGNAEAGNQVVISDRRPHTTAPAANGKPAAGGKVKPLPTPPGKPVYDPETGEVHGTRPQPIQYDAANPIAWGGRLVAEVTGAKTRAEAEAWIATNLENLQRCEREAPKVYDRVDANIEATRAKFEADQVPADFMPAK